MTADVVILTALQMELDALLRHGEWTQVPTPGASIRSYYLHTTQNQHVVVAAAALGMGQLNAALLATDVIRDWQPRKLILTGIAAGISKETILGDIVISDQVVDYELGKVTPSGFSPRWSVYRSDARLIDQLVNFREKGWTQDILVARPDGSDNVPHVHSGVILSGNKIIASSEQAGALRSVWSRAQAIEMEAAGVLAALDQRDEPIAFVMIKGICDRADELKGDLWQPYAADAAAAFTMAFLSSGVTDESLLPSPQEPRVEIPEATGVDLRALRLALGDGFDMDDLKVLLFDLGVDSDEIPGSKKSLFIVEIIRYMQRHGHLGELIAYIKTVQPGLLETYQPSKH